jgi:hypothetical protein
MAALREQTGAAATGAALAVPAPAVPGLAVPGLAVPGLAALALAAALGACSPGSAYSDGGPGAPNACAGVCAADGGVSNDVTVVDAGSASGGGAPTPSPACLALGYLAPPAVNERSLQQLRADGCSGVRVRVRSVVVTAVERDAAAADGGGSDQDFWVADLGPASGGMFVDKQPEDRVDAGTGGRVAVGDRLLLEGYYGTLSPQADQVGYRQALKGYPGFDPGFASAGGLEVTHLGRATPPSPVRVDAGVLDAAGGLARPAPALAGSWVQVEGPLELVDAAPAALSPRPLLADGGLGPPRVLGYALGGGVLVVDRRADGSLRLDGGAGGACAWGEGAADGGARVRFPTGVRGVWDTFTHAPCLDGGTAEGCATDRGGVPGTAGTGAADGGSPFTHVLYPQDCGDVPGEAAAP